VTDWRRVEGRELVARRLLPVVERLLEHERFQQLTVDRIVTEAGISRSTFYNYFEDKRDLLATLAAQVLDATAAATKVWSDLAPSAAEPDLRASSQQLHALYAPHAALMTAAEEVLRQP
jgi:TetR/AcrR family transcriptional regulator, ethionamide resistance regulator